ncbi:MAG: hypothetical protein QXS85_04920 [Acidilobaceae archaeon]
MLDAARELGLALCRDFKPEALRELEGSRRTKRGVHCADLLKLAARVLREHGEGGLCAVALALYLERARLLVDCAMRKAIEREPGEVVARPSEPPGAARLSSSLVECVEEEVSAINVVRLLDPCERIQAVSFIKSVSRRSVARRASGRLAALLEECSPICLSEQERATLSTARARLAEEAERVLEAMRRSSIDVARALCRAGLERENRVFCETVGE